MRNIKWYTWVGILFLFIIVTFVFVKVFSTIDQMAHTETMTVKVESEEIDHQIQLETETKEAGSLTSIKSIPFTKIESIDRPIKEWANNEEEMFFEEMEQAEVLLDYNASAHFSLQSDITPLTDELYNIAIVIEQSAEQESDHKSIKTFTIDLAEEKLVGLNKLTKEELTPNKLFKLLQQNVDNNLDKEKFQEHYETIEDINWTADNKNIIFYFGPNIITNYTLQINVPLMSFYPYLKDDYYTVFIGEELDEAIKQKEEEARRKKEKELKEKKAVLNKKKMVALTFDDGPHPEQTIRILDTLEKYDAKATFFTLGNNVKNFPAIAKRIVEDGHDLANHSMSHANLNAVRKGKAEKEIFDSQSVIEELTGQKPELFRPPYGNFEDNIEKMIAKSDQDIILWSVDTEDWKSKNAKKIFQNAKANTVPGSIILMHDIYPTTADALPKILKYYKEQGYECVTVSEMMPYIEDTYNNGAYFGN